MILLEVMGDPHPSKQATARTAQKWDRCGWKIGKPVREQTRKNLAIPVTKYLRRSAKICEVRRSSCRFPPRSLPFIRAATKDRRGSPAFSMQSYSLSSVQEALSAITFITAACLNYAGLGCKQRNTKFKNTCFSSGVDEKSSPHGWCT